MEEKVVYKLNPTSENYVSKDIACMDEWLMGLSDEELTRLHRMCNKYEDERTDDESFEITSTAFVMYCRELNIDEVSINIELLQELHSTFCFNVITESLRRRGMAKTDGPLYLYKATSVSLTEEGKKLMESKK